MAIVQRRWQRIARGVWVVRHDDLDLTTGVVIGSGGVLVVDTGADLVAGAGLLAELAEVEPDAPALPRTVLYTHAHYDHCYGTAALAPVQAGGGTAASGLHRVWAHDGCLTALRDAGGQQQCSVVAHYRSTGRRAAAERVAAVRPVLPTRTFTRSATVDLGDREVRLLHLGTGHTDHDAVALVADADVLFAGDLLENGAPPAFEDSHPAEWPVTLGRLLQLLGPTDPATTIVPGHGDPVDAAFVVAQRADLAAVAAACSTGTTDAGPYPADVMRTALAAARSPRSASPPR